MSTKSGGPEGGGGNPQPTQNLQQPGQVSMSPPWGGHGALGGNKSAAQRSFAQIIESEKANRNILEIYLEKVNKEENGSSIKPKSLTFDDLGELIFDILKVDPKDCLTFDYNSGRYDNKQIKLKPGIDTSKYTTDSPISFKDHMVTVTKQLSNVTRVTFKNVPLNVPDEELIHLCLCYGEPVDMKVHYETLNNSRNKGMASSTRYVDMVMNQGSCMENYYWVEGPLSGDKGRRILVLHNNQEHQCSHCLKKSSTGCPGHGNGKACEQLGTTRGKMYLYMQSLRAGVGYTSLKTLYMEEQARNFPSLTGRDRVNTEMNEDDEEVVPTNPIEQKDKKIASLLQDLERAKAKDEQINDLKEALNKSSSELRATKKLFYTIQQKLNFTKKATENSLVENISNPNGYVEDPVLIGVYSATLNEDEIDEQEEDAKVENDGRSRKENFLRSMEEKINLDNPDHKERYLQVKNKILEKVKTTKVSRSRSRSNSIGQGTKRNLSDEKLSESPPVRHKSNLPIKS